MNTTQANLRTFRNKNYTKRNYECTNVIACQSINRPNENWIECDESILEKLTKLWIENDIRYFGHL